MVKILVYYAGIRRVLKIAGEKKSGKEEIA
jgi:hypothetical protein